MAVVYTGYVPQTFRVGEKPYNGSPAASGYAKNIQDNQTWLAYRDFGAAQMWSGRYQLRNWRDPLIAGSGDPPPVSSWEFKPISCKMPPGHTHVQVYIQACREDPKSDTDPVALMGATAVQVDCPATSEVRFIRGISAVQAPMSGAYDPGPSQAGWYGLGLERFPVFSSTAQETSALKVRDYDSNWEICEFRIGFPPTVWTNFVVGPSGFEPVTVYPTGTSTGLWIFGIYYRTWGPVGTQTDYEDGT
jgi:hypothetical protein